MIYQLFEDCKGLEKRRDKTSSDWHHTGILNTSYCYYIKGFHQTFIIYSFDDDNVIWYSYGKKRSGRRIWEAMTVQQQKLFIFNLDWFLGAE